MKSLINGLGITVSLVLLILVRKYETVLFYDPFLAFYKQSNFKLLPTPEFNTVKLFLSLLFRYGLNTILSVIIIQLWFKHSQISKLSLYILIAGFFIFSSLYLLSLLTNFGLGYIPTFYIRRILIQPIFLFLLIPAIYYYLYLKKQKPT